MSKYSHFDIIQLTRKMEEAKERVDSIHYSLRATNEEVDKATTERNRLKGKLKEAEAELETRTQAMIEYFGKRG